MCREDRGVYMFSWEPEEGPMHGQRSWLSSAEPSPTHHAPWSRWERCRGTCSIHAPLKKGPNHHSPSYLNYRPRQEECKLLLSTLTPIHAAHEPCHHPSLGLTLLPHPCCPQEKPSLSEIRPQPGSVFQGEDADTWAAEATWHRAGYKEP